MKSIFICMMLLMAFLCSQGLSLPSEGESSGPEKNKVTQGLHAGAQTNNNPDALRDIEAPPTPGLDYFTPYFVVIALSLLLAGGLVAYASVSKRRKKAAVLSPYERTIAAFEALHHKHLEMDIVDGPSAPRETGGQGLNNGHPNRVRDGKADDPNEKMRGFYTELSTIIRNYLEEAFSLGNSAMTTDEFLQAAGISSVMMPDSQTALADLIRLCDRIKFAGSGSSGEEMEESFRKAKDIIESTREGIEE